jgi:ankyrin repeat protein
MCKCDSLLDAAYRNDIVKIEALVAERLHPDRPRANGNSPIHIAARLGHVSHNFHTFAA